ncbi:MAG: D-arabinono-1,4-lactone oxidase, partial [Bacteroidota bacterium]
LPGKLLRSLFDHKGDDDGLDNDLLQRLDDDPENESLLGEVTDHLEKVLDIAPEAVDVAVAKRRGRVRKDGTHAQWENQIGNQVVEPLQYRKPKNLGEVTAILHTAVAQDLKVKAAGSGHSYSDVATTPDFFIDTHSLNEPESDRNPIAGQLQQQDLKPAWRKQTMRAQWTSLANLPDITVDSPMDDILKVRAAAEGNTLLFETEAGITIHDLNKTLEKNDLGLPNMGGYDGQTIVGAISTSTHGSGITLGPFPDMLHSLVIATTGTWNGTIISGASSGPVNYYRIEPTNGITDPASYRQHQDHYRYQGRDIQLIQDDDCFHAVMVNMGTMGVIYSITIEVMQAYYLTETRQVNTLDKTLAQLLPDDNHPSGIPEILRKYRNYEILISPYPMKGNQVVDMDPGKPAHDYYRYFETLETKRNITPRKSDGHGDKPRDPITTLLGKLKISFKILVSLMNLIPKVTPKLISLSMNGLEDKNFVRESFNIYNLGLNGDAGFANEIGFPLQSKAGKYSPVYVKAAIDRIHAMVQKARKEGRQYQTSPFSIRFVRKSPAFLSMMNGVNTCMIEIDMVTGTYAGEEILNRQQEGLYEIGGRPHWGLEFDQLTGNHQLISTMYPDYPKWKAVYDQLNSKGTFDNKTTNRLGFSDSDYERRF